MFVMTFWGFIHIPVTASLFFLGIVAVMGYEFGPPGISGCGLGRRSPKARRVASGR